MEKYLRIAEANFGFTLTNEHIEKFFSFEKLLQKWNKKYNLTSIINPQEIYIKHFYDSLTCFSIIPSNTAFSLVDIGTGAGFPGIPLKIINPLIDLTLAESINKKAQFCQTAIEELGLGNVIIASARAETLGQDIAHRERYEWAIARAVAPLAVLVEYLLPFVRIGESIIAQKGIELDDEISQAEKAISTFGGKIKSIVPIALPDSMGMRTLIQITKIKPTPTRYPRQPGTPKKNPLI